MLVGDSDMRREMNTRRGVILKLPRKHCKERASVSDQGAIL
jgi:hypothetical protein